MRRRIYASTLERNQAIVARTRARRAACVDPEVKKLTSREKRARIDLGIELLMMRAQYGVPLTQEDMAAWFGCTDSAVYNMTMKALRRAAVITRFGRLRHVFQELRRSA